jgi:hypothetical protein
MVEYEPRTRRGDPLQDASRDVRDEDHVSNIMSLENRAQPEPELWHYPDSDIASRRPWQRIIFVGSLIAVILIALAATIFTFWSQL